MAALPGNPADALQVRVTKAHAMGPPMKRYEWRCPVCQGTYWAPLARKSETCSRVCGGKLRQIRNPTRMTDKETSARKRAIARAFVSEVNARTYCAHCGGQPIEWHNPDHVDLNRQYFRIGRMANIGRLPIKIQEEMNACTPLCRRCHMAEDGRLKRFVAANQRGKGSQ